MGEDKPKNALDEFWDNLGDKKKKYVRSYRPDKRNLPNKKNDARSDGKSDSNSSSRRG
jgi:hypothetical protein